MTLEEIIKENEEDQELSDLKNAFCTNDWNRMQEVQKICSRVRRTRWSNTKTQLNCNS